VVGASPADVAAGVERYARRALALDPRSARAWSALSEIQSASSIGLRLRLEYALRGASLSPTDDFTHTRLTSALFPASAYLAREAAHEAARHDPLVLTGHLYEAITSALVGDAERGMRCIETALALEPDAPFTRYMKSLVLVVAGRDAEAVGEAEALKPLGATGRLHPEWVRFADQMVRAHTVIAAGGRDAEELCAYLVAVAQGHQPFPRWQSSTSGVPILLTRYGRPDAALDLLLARREAGVREPLDLLVLHPDMASLSGDARYRLLVSDAATQFRILTDVATAARSRNEMPPYIDRALRDLASRPAIAAAVDAAD
jgi:hypothetical protein